jgi:hypothetical protein
MSTFGGFRYDGAPLTRGEFITHMERLDETLHSIDERVGAIEERLNRKRRVVLGAIGVTATRLFVVGTSIAITFLLAHYGVPDPGIW